MVSSNEVFIQRKLVNDSVRSCGAYCEQQYAFSTLDEQDTARLETCQNKPYIKKRKFSGLTHTPIGTQQFGLLEHRLDRFVL